MFGSSLGDQTSNLHWHPLFETRLNYIWTCNVCGHQGYMTDPVYSCRQCPFNAWQKCFTRGAPKANIHCHPLIINYQGPFRCDLCYGTFSAPNILHYHCAQCNFNVCKLCYEQRTGSG